MSGELPIQVPNADASELEVGAPLRDGRPIRRPEGVGAYSFAVVSALRAGQLLRGCIPRVNGGDSRATVIAQLEVARGKVAATPNGDVR